ncbi:MAG: M23 family metallopeptidase [Actinomycetota bacterium]
MRRLILLTLLLSVAAPALPSASTAAQQDERYLPPVLDDSGMTFPVLRSSWYSVIELHNDWHAPRMRRIDGSWELVGRHEGNDIFAEPGTPVVAVTPGRVERVGWTFYSGWRVGIRDAEGRYWFYAHLERFAPGIRPGASVSAGDSLGAVGNTGYGSDPGHKDEFTYHLHLGIQEADGQWVNPYPLMRRLYRVAVEGG